MGAHDLLEQVGAGVIVGPPGMGGLVRLSLGVGHVQMVININYHVNDLGKYRSKDQVRAWT
jgi:hypothetical protein